MAVDLSVPPNDRDAERAVLGAMLMGADAALEAVSRLDREDFYRESHAVIYDAMRALVEANEPIDLVVVSNELERRGKLEQVGGASYLAQLPSAIPTIAHSGAYITIVADLATRRRLIHAATDVITDARQSADAVSDLVDRSEQRMFAVADQRVQSRSVSVSGLMSSAMEQIAQYQEQRGTVTGLTTGFRDLDETIDGLHPSELAILAARPSMGKTSLALNIALRAAMDSERGVLIYSLETDRKQIMQNMLCMEARVDSHVLRRGRLSETAYRDLSSAASRIYNTNIHIDDTPGMSIMELRGGVRRARQRNTALGLVIVDYLQLLDARLSGRSTREQEVAFIARSLKNIARENHLPVLALAQLNRSVESRSTNRPRLSDLRESGEIEQTADLVMLLHREGYYNPARGDDGKTEVIVAKQRNGPIGSVYLTFLRRYLRFEAYAEFDAPAAPETVGGYETGF